MAAAAKGGVNGDRQLLSMPDDVLLAILAYLPARQLFACRVVCCRLRDLCLHPMLWRAVAVESEGVLRAAFAVAPCIGRLADKVPVAVVATLMEDTTCVVDDLRLSVKSSKDAALAAAVVQKLSSDGGVTKLSLKINCSRTRSLLPLLKAAYNVKGLLSIKVTLTSREPLPGDWCKAQLTPSATKLCYAARSADGFLELLLRTHAATLERVELSRLRNVPVSLLAQAPRLRFLECFAGEDLSQLVALPNLTEVQLTSKDREGETAAGVRGFLTRTSLLRNVVLSMPVPRLDELLPALAASPSARYIKELTVDDTGESWPNFSTDRLAPFLTQFASLTTLCLMDAEPHPDLLRALGDAPCFHTLKCIAPLDKCTHGWLHDPAMQHFLVVNYHVHLVLMLVYSDFYCHTCIWCRWGCHKLLSEARRGPSGSKALQLSCHNWRGCGDWNCVQVFGRKDRPYSDPV